MYLPFVCNHCSKDKWAVIYDTETKGHLLNCANCGKRVVLEEVFGNKRIVLPKKKVEAIRSNSEVKEDVEVQQKGN